MLFEVAEIKIDEDEICRKVLSSKGSWLREASRDNETTDKKIKRSKPVSGSFNISVKCTIHLLNVFFSFTEKVGFFYFNILYARNVKFSVFSATVATISYTKAYASFKLTVCDHPYAIVSIQL